MNVHISGPKIIFFVLALCATVMIFTSSFFNVLYDSEFYTKEFKKLNGQVKTIEPEIKTSAIISYFSEPGNEPMYQSEVVFTDKQMTVEEISHLQDVKLIIQKTKQVYFSSFFLFIIILIGFGSSLYIKYKGKDVLKEKFTLFFIKLQVYILALTALVLTAFGIASFFMFDAFFTAFHKLLFPQGNWTFPANSLLISLFPEMFFSDFFLQMLGVIIKFIALLAVLFGIIYITYVLKQPKKERKEHREKITTTLIGKHEKSDLNEEQEQKEDF